VDGPSAAFANSTAHVVLWPGLVLPKSATCFIPYEKAMRVASAANVAEPTALPLLSKNSIAPSP
jgi:hypothetical protein